MGVKMGVKMGVIGLRPRASVSPFAVPIVLREAHNFHERSELTSNLTSTNEVS